MNTQVIKNDENNIAFANKGKSTIITSVSQVRRPPLSSVENVERSKINPGKVAKAKTVKTKAVSNPTNVVKTKNIVEQAKILSASKDDSMDTDSLSLIQNVSAMGIQSPPPVSKFTSLLKNQESKEERRTRLNILDIDQEDLSDPQACAEYAQEIMEYTFRIEEKYMPDSQYMNKQTDLNWKMRSTLVNWLVEVHFKYKLYPETLFLAVNVMDRYLSVKPVSRNLLQLVGVTSLLIASKFEEIYSPSIEDFLYMCNDSYTNEQILTMERTILCSLGFELGYPCSLNFLRRISKADNYDIPTRTVAKYLIEVVIIDEAFIGYKPSLVAASSMWLARKMLDKGEWTATLEFYSEYNESQMEPCVNQILAFLESNNKYKSVYKKYSSSKFLRASLFVEQYLKRVSGDRIEENDRITMA